MNSFDRWLEIQKNRVEEMLREYIQSLHETPVLLKEAMGYSLLGGGKRMRPILCLAFAEALAKRSVIEAPLRSAIVAIESVHTYSLIHDDLPSMDNDDLRRGLPTSHKKFGEAMAILAGDALLTDAFSALSVSDNDSENTTRLQLMGILSRAAGSFGMVGGQVLDVDTNRLAELSYLKKLHRLKTGVLIEAACCMGVVAVKGSSQALSMASQYGSRLGLAFQITDDVLDVTSSASAMGKPTKADAASGRHTFPAVLGLEESRLTAKKLIDEAIESISSLEPQGGPLTSLALYCVSRSS